MNMVMAFLLTMTVMANLVTVGCAKTASERRAATPTMSERLSKESVKGRVNSIGPKYISIKEDNGASTRVRVDDNTKMDPVVVGDQVKAYITDDGYASTIQRVAG